MNYKLKVKILKGEYWYGGDVNRGMHAPFTRKSIYSCDSRIVRSYNQSAPFYVSNKGRYIWSEEGFKISFTLGKIECISQRSEIKLYEGFETLRGAYKAAMSAHFPPDGICPHKELFVSPQYCTWIEFGNKQNQDGIIGYAQSILDAGMPAGELIIDDGWQKDFGDWSFNERFHDPKSMIETLHEMGFRVLLWLCPFVSPKAPEFEELKEKNYLVKAKDGSIAIRSWWNGKSAVLDLSNPDAMEYLKGVCDNLMRDFGVDGFKQDAGDPMYYCDDDQTAANVSANDQCRLWLEFARGYEFNELRAAWKGGGIGVAERLSDKSHMWNKFAGVRALVPCALTQGITGYAFCCPDMVGGGQIKDFDKKEEQYDHELFIRSAQCSALMPMMQFSLSLWRLKNKNTSELVKKSVQLHLRYADMIYNLAQESAKTGEPIIRYLAYQFPHQNMEKAKHQFVLGDSVIVAPVVKKGQRKRSVLLPEGKWLFNGIEYTKGKHTIHVPLDVLPIFEKKD